MKSTMMNKKNHTVISNIRIINWYEIEDITIPLGGNALIFARNKTGKSTIIDAITYCLTNRKAFNKAANEYDDRDVKGYVRKKVNGLYQRKGYISGHIAVEITNKDNEVFTIGTVMDSKNDSDNVKSSWYITDKPIKDIKFTEKIEDGKYPLNFADFKEANNLKASECMKSGDKNASISQVQKTISNKLYHNQPKNTPTSKQSVGRG